MKLTKACCVCHIVIEPGDSGSSTTHGYCPPCKVWYHDFAQRMIRHDPTATPDEFDRQVLERRMNMRKVEEK